MIYINQKYFKKENDIIAYAELVLDLGNEDFNECYQFVLPIPQKDKVSFNRFARSLGFSVGKVETPPAEKRIYLD